MTLSDGDFEFLSKYILDNSAIVVSKDKEYLIESRLSPVCRRHGLPAISDLVQKLRLGRFGPLGADVVEAMTTNETYFFRDVKPFDGLKKEVFPELIARNATSKTLRIWCAASSSGQEPYSIAMVLRDSFPQIATWNIKIVCTDLSKAMVARTNEGIYSQLEVNRGLPAPMLIKYFEKRGDQWHIKPQLKELITASEMNLAKPWPSLGRFDLVFMRNVLIYFDVPTKQRIFDSLAKVMTSGAYLFLGGSESTLGLRTNLIRTAGSVAHYYRTPEVGGLKAAV
jgi:chemotaxis protein methyltransferase CheR